MINEKILSRSIKDYFKSKVENEMQMIDILEANVEIHKIIEQHTGKDIWLPVEAPPSDDRYVLMSFENFSIPLVGRYVEDEDGGGFFAEGDEFESCLSQGLFVNAWMELPKPYRQN